ncbi:MAG TPA: sirohydrochlorin chelatase [Amycolatopsis sp.]|uniref:sirohydrochlorin chelatase n=1 Tax=Amycolatopsis sp. TaxID=37632 RepID=UPI002B4A4D64|nr:sirohydrochlorin chelatase [Amycolatopsis sp.]HKS47782.1 sirohydrochlorin chelatase [Amycolatopsis sp.]
MIPLVTVAHGSRDPRSAATIRALARRIPGARVSFLDLSTPLTGDVLRSLHDDGHRAAVVVPLLLGSAYHARVDLPALTDRAPLRVSISDVLGGDPVLEEVALDRLAETGADLSDPALGVVVAAVGSSHAPANAAVTRTARRWQARHGFLATPAFVGGTLAAQDVPTAVARLRARGARRIAVASWFLAPGLLPDRVAALAPDARVATPLAPDPRIAGLVLRRYGEALMAARCPIPAPAGLPGVALTG